MTAPSMFSRLSNWTARETGRPRTFALAVATVLAWAVSGPAFHYSEGWQLVINTGTTIITFLMVFLLQATQTHDTSAIHAKLDALIAATDAANNRLIRSEELSEEQLEQQRALLTKTTLDEVPR